jgi:hypothetical protein
LRLNAMGVVNPSNLGSASDSMQLIVKLTNPRTGYS